MGEFAYTPQLQKLHVELGSAEDSLDGVDNHALRTELQTLQNAAQSPYLQDAGAFSGSAITPDQHAAAVTDLRARVAAFRERAKLAAKRAKASA